MCFSSIFGKNEQNNDYNNQYLPHTQKFIFTQKPIIIYNAVILFIFLLLLLSQQQSFNYVANELFMSKYLP